MQVGGTYTWNIAVPNGTYNVHIVSGDPSYTDSNDQLKVENTLIVSGKPLTGNYWIDGSGQVTVSDGMLTIAPATGASNDKINFIQTGARCRLRRRLYPDPGSGGSTGDGIDPGDNPQPGSGSGSGSGSGTGPETVQVSAPDPSAAETNLDPGVFRFTRTGPTDQDLTVNYLVTGTASAGGDFVPLPTSVVIPAGQSSVDLPVTPIDDGQLEPAQTVRIELNGGNYVIGASQSATVTIMDNETSSTEQPYSGTAAQLSGTVQAEDFDQGPKGTAYSITTAATNKDVYRFSDVDIEPTTDTGGGFAVTNLQTDEWMRYRVNVPANGTYRIETRVASTNVGSKFHIQFNGATVASLTMPNTGSVNTWTTLVSSVKLTAGVQLMRFYVDSNAKGGSVGSLNYIRAYQDLNGSGQGVNFSATTSLPSARQDAQSATVGGKYYVFGGLVSDGSNLDGTTRVDQYDPSSKTWTRMGDMPEAITHAAVAVVGTQVWLMGGYVGNDPGPATTHVWIYDSTSDSWSAGPDLPAARGAGAGGVVGSVIHFFGGRNGTRDMDEKDHWAFDLNNTDAGWQTLASLPSRRNDLAGAVVNGKLYAVAGQQLEKNAEILQSEVDVYDPASDSWSRVSDAPLPLTQIGESTVVYDNKILTIGGELGPNAPSGQVLMFDPSTNVWSLLGYLPSGRDGMTAGVFGNQLIAAGGSTGSASSTGVWLDKLWQGSGALTSFTPGAEWDDTAGNPIQAHGGGVMYQNGVYYWYGENKAGTTTIMSNGQPRVDVIGVSVYTSTDLYNWTYHGLALPGTTTGDLAPANVLERPKVIYNSSTGKYVMWMHIDNSSYSKASVGVAVSDSPLGPFVYQGSFRPLGMDSRDMTVFQDDDGSAYLIFATNSNHAIRIAKMTPDYLGLTGESVQPYTTSTQREAPQMVKENGKYFLITSQATWFNPNAAMYAWSSNVMGQYTVVGNPAYGNLASTTYNSQGTFILQVAGTDEDIFMADRWNASNLGASRYVWLPIKISGTSLTIDNPATWDLSYFG